MAGLELVRELIKRHAIACDWVDGHMQVAIKQRHEIELQALLRQLNERYGYTAARYMQRDEVRTVLATSRYIGALYDGLARSAPSQLSLGHRCCRRARRSADLREQPRTRLPWPRPNHRAHTSCRGPLWPSDPVRQRLSRRSRAHAALQDHGRRDLCHCDRAAG